MSKEKQNVEKKREQGRKYYKTHKEHLKAYQREYYKKHKNDAAWMTNHTAKKTEWINNNRDKWNAYQRERYKSMKERADRKQSEGEWHWIADDSPMCNICGKVFDTNDNADAGLWKYCPECGAKMKGGE